MKPDRFSAIILLVIMLSAVAGCGKGHNPDEQHRTQTSNQFSQTGPEGTAAPRVMLDTSQGKIVVELDPVQAPVTVANFLRYVAEDGYQGTIFHRVISGFMIQGGGYLTNYLIRPTHKPIKNEADNGLHNERGTIAMARTREPDSATRQFFINVADNDFLDHQSDTTTGWGYAVFGHVVEGMDVVDRISNLPTGEGGPFSGDVPTDMVTINRIAVLPDDSTDIGEPAP